MPSSKSGAAYAFDHHCFDHGLLCKIVKPTSVTTIGVCMPTNIYCLFLESGHPDIFEDVDASFPLILEWEFVEGDKVNLIAGAGTYFGQTGTIQAVQNPHLIVALNDPDEGGIVKVKPHQLRKAFSVGNFVKILRGVSKDQMGWVVKVDEHDMEIVERHQKNPQIKVSK